MKKNALNATQTIGTRHIKAVSNLAVDCPVCEAQAGEHCIDVITFHSARRRMAIRRQNDDPAEQVRSTVNRWPVGRRRRIRESQRIWPEALGREIDVDPQKIRAWERGRNIPPGEEANRYATWLMEHWKKPQATPVEVVVTEPVPEVSPPQFSGPLSVRCPQCHAYVGARCREMVDGEIRTCVAHKVRFEVAVNEC